MKRILRRVKLDLTKKFSKTFLKCVVFTILFSMLFSSLYIQNISKQLENSIVGEFDIYAEINPNIQEEGMELETFLQETSEYEESIRDIATHTSPSYYDFNLTNKAFRSLIRSIKIEGDNVTLYDSGGSSPISNEEIWEQINTFWLISSDVKSVRSSVPKDIEMKAATLVAGRTFNENELINGEHVCIIPNGFREYRDGKVLSVWLGDEIVLSEFVQDENGNIVHYKEHTYTVIGVYNAENGVSMETMSNFLESPIYIPELAFGEMIESPLKIANETYDNYLEEHSAFVVHSTIFKFSTIDDFKGFINYLENYADKFDEGYTYSTTMETQFSSISNILSISKSIFYISALCFIACICITFILLLFDIETSKKEIGILLSLGESFKAVVIQYILEMLIVSLIAITVSFAITQTIGVRVANRLVQDQIIQEESVQFNDSSYKVEVEHYEEILQPLSITDNIKITSVYIIGICLFESILLIFLIKRIDPKELLKDS